MKKRVNKNGIAPRSAPRSMDAATLYAQTFAAPAFIVPDMLLSGHLTLVAGRPKSWKTWLLLELTIAVASGRMFLERPIVTPGRVLFVELDDDRQQLHERLHLLVPRIGTDDHQALKNINFAHSLKPLRQGGLRDLEQQLKEALRLGKPYQLVIIDPYMAIRSTRRSKDWVADDYRELKELRALCIKYQCTGVLACHLRKAGSPHAADKVLGTTGITAAVDSWWIVMDDPDNPKHKLVEVKGRSIPETMLRIGFNARGPNPGVYAVNEGIELKAGPEGQELLLLLKERGPLTPAEIATARHCSPNSVYQLLSRLRQRDMVLKEGTKYVYPS
jgi:hypothetical protein